MIAFVKVRPRAEHESAADSVPYERYMVGEVSVVPCVTMVVAAGCGPIVTDAFGNAATAPGQKSSLMESAWIAHPAQPNVQPGISCEVAGQKLRKDPPLLVSLYPPLIPDELRARKRNCSRSASHMEETVACVQEGADLVKNVV